VRWRLVAAFAGVMVVVLLALGLPLAGHLRDVEADRLIAELQRDAFILGGTAQDAIAEGETATSRLQSTIDVYANTDGAAVVVTDEEGDVLASSSGGPRRGTNMASQPELAAALGGVPASASGDPVAVAVPLRDGAAIVGAIQVTSAPGVISNRANDKFGGLAMVGLISLVAAVIAALFMAGTIARPLRRLRRSTERVAKGDFSVDSSDAEGPPEVRDLVDAFGAMTTRVATLVEQQRSFASDASHQLRTPLTALRLQLERASELVDEDPVAATDQVDAAMAEVERLQRMVEGLLVLARNGGDERTEPVDLVEVGLERVDVWRPLAEEREVQLDTVTEIAAPALAVPGAVEQVIDNFIDNALNVADPGSTIEVVVGRKDGWAELHVMDRGPGMSDEQLAHAFDRFWRAPDAATDGSGLGLSIVRHLATASGGEVSLRNRADGGIDACLRLPSLQLQAAR
jgi:signal transduction histidine kinase